MDEFVVPHGLPYANLPCLISIPADVIERCELSFDIRNFTYLSLLRAVLAIRQCGGRYKRAFKTLEDIGIPVPVVVYVVKKICKILNCGNLDANIPEDDTIRAFEQFLQLQHPESSFSSGPLYSDYGGGYPQGNHIRGQPPMSPHYEEYQNNSGPQALNPNAASFNYCEPRIQQQQQPMMPPPPPPQEYYPPHQAPQRSMHGGMDHYHPREYETHNNPDYGGHYNQPPVYNHQQHMPQQQYHPYTYEEQPHYPGADVPPLGSRISMPSRPADIHVHILSLLLPEVSIDHLLQDSPSNRHALPPNKSRLNSVASHPDINSVSHLFWILSICLFITVCDDRQPLEESLFRLYELCRFVGSGNGDLLTMSPVLGVALDVIVQRAVYELSDKITLQPIVDPKEPSKDPTEQPERVEPPTSDEVFDQPELLYSLLHTSSPNAHDLYKCISLMLHSVTDSCIRIETSFLPGHNPPSPVSTGGAFAEPAAANSYAKSTQTSMNSRTQKLAKQLREALAWSCCHDQLPTDSRQALAKTTVTVNPNQSSIDSPRGASLGNLTSRSTMDISEIYRVKCKAADQVVSQIIQANRATSDVFYQDMDAMKNRVGSLFQRLSSEGSSEFDSTSIDMGGLSGTSLITCMIGAVPSNPGSKIPNSSRSSGGQLTTIMTDIEYILNIPSLDNKISFIKSQKLILQNKLNTFNDILRIDATIENCLKHIKACIKEARIQISSYCNDLQSYAQIYSKKFYVMNQAKQRRGPDVAFEMIAKITRLRDDMEALCSLGDKLISIMGNNLRSLRSNGVAVTAAASRGTNSNSSSFRIDSSPIVSNDYDTLSKLPILLQSRRFLCDELLKLNDLESVETKKYIKSLEQVFREARFPLLKVLLRSKHSGFRFGHLNLYGVGALGGDVLPGRSPTNAGTVGLIGPGNNSPTHINLNNVSSISNPNPPSTARSNASGYFDESCRLWGYFVMINDTGLIDSAYHRLGVLYMKYIQYDKTNKIRYYFGSIIHFARVHALADSDNGTLVVEAWLLLALHVLLHHEIVPNIHEETEEVDAAKNPPSMEGKADTILSPRTPRAAGEDELAGGLSSRSDYFGPLSARSAGSGPKTKLQEISLLGLLELFFRYLTEELDILNSIVTIRGKGQTLLKNEWRVESPVMWRLCIEDPFENSLENISRPFDLGATLTRPGQIQIFKAIRRASFGINAIVIKDVGETEKYVRMLFHKDDLLSLSRISGYNGAAVISTPIYRPSPGYKSNIIHVWTSDRSLHSTSPVTASPALSTVSDIVHLRRHGSGTGSFSSSFRLTSRPNSFNLGSNPPPNNNPASQAPPVVAASVVNQQTYIDDSIQVEEFDYVDSDSENDDDAPTRSGLIRPRSASSVISDGVAANRLNNSSTNSISASEVGSQNGPGHKKPPIVPTIPLSLIRGNSDQGMANPVASQSVPARRPISVPSKAPDEHFFAPYGAMDYPSSNQGYPMKNHPPPQPPPAMNHWSVPSYNGRMSGPPEYVNDGYSAHRSMGAAPPSPPNQYSPPTRRGVYPPQTQSQHPPPAGMGMDYHYSQQQPQQQQQPMSRRPEEYVVRQDMIRQVNMNRGQLSDYQRGYPGDQAMAPPPSYHPAYHPSRHSHPPHHQQPPLPVTNSAYHDFDFGPPPGPPVYGGGKVKMSTSGYEGGGGYYPPEPINDFDSMMNRFGGESFHVSNESVKSRAPPPGGNIPYSSRGFDPMMAPGPEEYSSYDPRAGGEYSAPSYRPGGSRAAPASGLHGWLGGSILNDENYNT